MPADASVETREARVKRLLLVAAVVSITGVFLAGSEHVSVGSWVTVAGWALFGLGLHRYGRLGS